MILPIVLYKLAPKPFYIADLEVKYSLCTNNTCDGRFGVSVVTDFEEQIGKSFQSSEAYAEG